jgi:transposase-like protein
MSEAGIRPRQFSNAFKEAAVRRLGGGEKIAAVASTIGVRRKLLYQWRDAWRAMGSAGFNRQRGRKPGWKAAEAGAATAPSSCPDAVAPAAPASHELRKAQARIAELERLIGRQQADLHFFREALRLWDATPPNGGAPISTRSCKK